MNLYQIEQRLVNILTQLEEQDGIFTDEQLEELQLCKEDFANKIGDYHHVLQNINSDISSCKEEEARIKALRQSKERISETIKKIMLTAVRSFGTEQKNGVMSFDGGTFKLSTRMSTSYNEDELRTENLLRYIQTYFDDFPTETILDDNQEIAFEGILTYVNNYYLAECKEHGINPVEQRLYSMDDLFSLTVEVNNKIDFRDLITNVKYKYILMSIANGTLNTKNVTDKNTMKELINTGHVITLGNTVNNCSLQVK